MISQIIEARPEDLRVYLEEAAGISKYKERRKETETRIRHTRENLDRLNDLREEVGKQLEHLKRQARQAEQYQAIQAERRVKDAEWKALEHRALDQKLQGQREKLAQQETRLQQLIAEQREAEREIETGRVRREEAAEALNKAQAASYEVSGALARIEQQIQHQREMSTRLQRARDEAQTALSEIATHIGSDQSRLDVLRAAVAEAEPQPRTAARGRRRAPGSPARRRDSGSTTGSSAGTTHSRAQSEAARAADVERTRIEHLDRQTARCRPPPRSCSATSAPGSTWRALAEAFAGAAGAARDPEAVARQPQRRAGNPQGRASASCRNSSAPRSPNWPKCASRRRPRAAACRRWKPCSTPRSARSRAPR